MDWNNFYTNITTHRHGLLIWGYTSQPFFLRDSLVRVTDGCKNTNPLIDFYCLFPSPKRNNLYIAVWFNYFLLT